MTSELIQPLTRPINKAITLPGSKSITNRALLLSALSNQTLTLHNVPQSKDTLLMAEGLKALGFCLERQEDRVTVTGQAGQIPKQEADLQLGNAGTVARFLTAALCFNKSGSYTLVGSTQMHTRPMRGLFDALEALGASIEYSGEAHHFPITLKTNGLNSQHLKVDASQSSQILSALLIIAPFAPAGLHIELIGDTVSRPFVEMTLSMMKQFGYTRYTTKNNTLYFPPCTEPPYTRTEAYTIEPDATAASYFLTLPRFTQAHLQLNQLCTSKLQGDITFAKIIDPAQNWIHFNENGFQITADPTLQRTGIEANFNAISDTFLTAAASAPLLETKTHIWGIAHTRQQETDRIHAMATELKKLGQTVSTTHDSITITPDRNRLKEYSKEKPVEIETYSDHRIAMSFAILGSYDLHTDGRPWISIKNPECCKKTFPNFFKILKDLHNDR